MARVSRERGEVNARILYWGAEGAGKSASLRAAFDKLRPDHRGEIKQVPTRIDPTVGYEVLPISLGEIAGVRTQIEMIAVPGQKEQAPTRKQLLDQVDGVVFVADARAERAEANAAALHELRQALAAYGRSLEQLPLVVQYNRRDQADPYAIEDLHRRLGLGQTPVFEASATQGTGVLQTLSTISKRVIRALRERGAGAEAPAAGPPADAPPPSAPPEPAAARAIPVEPEPLPPLTSASVRAADAFLDSDWEATAGEIERPSGARIGPDLTIVSVGEAARRGEREVVVPLVLGDESGQTSTLVLSIRLDPLVEDGDGA
jgi:hypothetical protein